MEIRTLNQEASITEESLLLVRIIEAMGLSDENNLIILESLKEKCIKRIEKLEKEEKEA